MYIHTKLKQLEEMGIDSPSALADLLIKGILPNGQTIDDRTRKEYISVTCGIVYETTEDIRHIQNFINN